MFNRHQSNHFLRHKLSISLLSIKLIFKYHDKFVALTKDCHIYKLCHRVDEKKTITMKDIKCAVHAPELAEYSVAFTIPFQTRYSYQYINT